MSQACETAASAQQSTESKLLKRKLPKFEAPRDYASALAAEEEQERADVVFDTAYHAAKEAQEKPDRTNAEALDAVLTCIASQNSLREILFKTLRYCAETKDFDDVDAFIAASDEVVHSHALQTPFSMIQMLKKCGGLVERGYDAQGEELTRERCAGLSKDEISDLVESVTLTTSEAGLKAVELIAPEKRFNSLINQRPHRKETFYALMDFCQQPRKFPEIQQFFKDTPGLALDTVQVHHTLSPDFYVDKLDKAGVLVWMGAWVLTPEGRELLAQHTAPEE